VVVVNSGWQPYCNDGYWLWTDCGWYWNSYYSWGWAPFHYGRWCQYPHYGWVWCPDRVWGPAWVCWRTSGAYCGWAALPPGACHSVGVGWTFNGASVGFNFGFGLGSACFTFCDYDHFCDRHPYHHFHHGHDADHFFHETQPHNDWVTDAHHRLFDRSIDPHRVEAATHQPLHEVAVRELPRGGGRFTMPDRLERSGDSTVIYRPGSSGPAPRNPFLATTSNSQRPYGERHNFGSARAYGGGVQNAPGATPSMPHRPGPAPEQLRQYTGPARGVNESHVPRTPAPGPGRSEPVHPQNPIHQAPQRQPVEPARPFRSPRMSQSYSWNNPYPRESVPPSWTANSGWQQQMRPARAPSPMPAPAGSPQRTFISPRQSESHPAAPSGSFSRPTQSYGGGGGGHPAFRGGGNFAVGGGNARHFGR